MACDRDGMELGKPLVRATSAYTRVTRRICAVLSVGLLNARRRVREITLYSRW